LFVWWVFFSLRYLYFPFKTKDVQKNNIRKDRCLQLQSTNN
jgi:hypothetical protein